MGSEMCIRDRACSRSLVGKRGFRPAEGSKVRNLAYNGSPNDFTKLILNLPEVLRGSDLIYTSGEMPMQCNKAIKKVLEGQNRLIFELQGEK